MGDFEAWSASGWPIKFRIPGEAEITAVDQHLPGMVVGHLGIFKDKTDVAVARRWQTRKRPDLLAKLVEKKGRPILATEELERAVMRVARRSVPPIPGSPGRPITRAEGYGYVMALSGPAAPANSPLRRTWEAVMRICRQFAVAQVAPRPGSVTDARDPSPPQSASSALPKVERGFGSECDELVRQFLREQGWGQEPTEPGQLWLLRPPEVKQLWRKSGELADRCPVQDKNTSHDTRRKTLRRAFKRVTGS
jgi:hypothetical protein